MLIAAVSVAAIGCDDASPRPSSPGTAAAPSGPGPASAPAPPREPGRAAALGDSITAGSPGFDPDPRRRSELGFGDDRASQYQYWAESEDHRLEFTNCGVFGERTDEIALRLEECVREAGAQAIVIQGGINDIAQGRDPSTAAGAIASMVARAEGLGLEVAVADVLPWNNGHPAADEPIARLNRLIRGIARAEDVTLLPFHAALEDPHTPGTMRSELTADGDHPSIDGYRRLGRLVARSLGR